MASPCRRSVALRLLLPLAATGVLVACSDGGSSGDGAATGAAGESGESGDSEASSDGSAVPGTDAATGPLTGSARVSCGPVTAAQLEPVAAVLRQRVAGIDGAAVGTSDASPTFLLVALPDSVGDAEAAGVCAAPSVDVRPVLQELPDVAPGATVAPVAIRDAGVFLDEDGIRQLELGAVVADAATVAPGAVAQEVQGTGWKVAATLTADGTAVWTTALDGCFARTAACPLGTLAYVVDGVVVGTGPVPSPAGDAPAFVLPGTFSEATARRLAALIDVVAAGEFGPAAG